MSSLSKSTTASAGRSRTVVAPGVAMPTSAPTLSGVSPGTGGTGGGQSVTLTGTNFQVGATTVSFGGSAGTSVVVAAGGLTLTCNTPAHVHGAVSVSVTTPGGTSGTQTFTYNTIIVTSFANTVDSGQVGDIGGGYAGTLTGSGFLTCTGVSVGGTACTGITVVNDTTITLTMPAHASGSGNTFTVTSAGDSGTGGTYEFFSPAQLSCSGWWRANYSGSPWAPTASTGSSGSNGNLAGATANPATGTAVNGLTPASFNGTTQDFQAASGATTFWTNGAGTIIVLYNATSAAAPAVLPYNDDGLVTGIPGSALLTLGVNTTGVRFALFDSGGQEDLGSIAASASTWHLAQMTWDSTNLKGRVDGGSQSALAAGAINALSAADPYVGANYTQGAFLTGLILETVFAPTAFTLANLDKIRAYARTRYNISTL